MPLPAASIRPPRWSAEDARQFAHAAAYLSLGPFGKQVLHIQPCQESDAPPEPIRDLLVVHRVRLDRVDDVQADLDEITEDRLDVAACVEPEVQPQRMALGDQLRVERP